MSSYTNNKEYRQALREFFQMKCQQTEVFVGEGEASVGEALDEETLDEMNYDEKAVEKSMNEIYSKTKHIGVFRELYQIAAGHMFSVDHETGLAVLLCYDYFLYFKSLYEKFTEFSKDANRIIQLSNDEISDKLEDTNEYKILLNLITPIRR
jgi:hypothetical protein